MGKIRAANLAHSHRLQNVFQLLSDGFEHSTWEIIQSCKVAAVNSVIAELKAQPNGLTIRHRYRDGGNWYRMERNHAFFSWRRQLQTAEAWG